MIRLFMHKPFMSQLPLQATTPQSHGPNGQGLVHFGCRDVMLKLMTGQRVRVRFQVLDVARPILSAMRLREKGIMTVIGPQPYIQRNKR